MSYTKKIVCLANSRKPPSGRCIAGREVTSKGFGAWIRPVSSRPTQEISDSDRRYKNGTYPDVLDIISIEMTQPVPHLHQQENHLIDDGYYWVKRDSISWADLQEAVEDPSGPLWVNGCSTWRGCNDQVPENSLAELKRSLYLVRPAELKLTTVTEGGDFGPPRRRVRADFRLCGFYYCLVVTDPSVEKKCFAKPDRELTLEDVVLCVSLGEIYLGFAYKLVAAVITPRHGRELDYA